MVEIKTEWNEKNLRNYIIYKTFFANTYTLLTFVVLIFCFLGIIATCITMYCLMNMPVFIIMGGAVILFSAGFVGFFVLKINKNVKQSLKESGADSGALGQETALIAEALITIYKNGVPYGIMEWDKVTSISFNDKGGAAYLCTEDGAVFILEYKNITSGTESELKEILKIKDVKLSNKA